MANNDSFSDSDLMKKIGQMPKNAGCAVLRSALTLYVLLKESDIPVWAKGSAIAALVYFISPIDAIPDFLPGGYVDDLAMMALLLGQLNVFVDKSTVTEVNRLLPSYCREEKDDGVT